MYFMMKSLNKHLLSANSTFGVGSFLDISADGNTLYTTDAATETFKIYNVSNVASPTLTKSQSTGASTSPMGIRKVGNYLYICYRHATNQGLAVWDISTPSAPSYVTTLTLTRPVRIILDPAGTYAYVINGVEPGGGSNGTNMYIIDITTQSAPVIATNGTYTGAAFVYPSGIVKSPTTNHVMMSVTNGYNGLHIVSAAPPAAPTLAGQVSTAPNFSPISVHCDEAGDWAYMCNAENTATNHFVTLDTRSKTGPSVQGYQTLTPTVGGGYLGWHTIYGSTMYTIRGGRIFSFGIGGVNASSPVLYQTITSNILNDVVVAGTRSLAFSADDTSVVHVFNIT